jgi:hypothetical protein
MLSIMLTFKGQPAPWSAFGAANMVPGRLDVDIAAHQIIRWLQDCEGSHECSRYRRRITKLPTRVLDLGEDPKPQDPIKLFETEGAEGTYMTLSHCWGPAQFITTTEATIEQRIAGIPLADLPQTFKDVVSLTRNLKIRYLWIDSLCIKQLHKDDWESEAGKMGSVYSQSFLNIAATSSAESSGGCFKDRLALIPTLPFPLALKTYKVRAYLGSGGINVRLSLKSAHIALERRGIYEASMLAPLVSIFCSLITSIGF